MMKRPGHLAAVVAPADDRAIRAQGQTVPTARRNGCEAGIGGGVADLARPEKVVRAMRPSATFNRLLETCLAVD